MASNRLGYRSHVRPLITGTVAAVLGAGIAGRPAVAQPSGIPPAPRAARPPGATPFLGVDANYSLGMETAGRSWRWSDEAEDLFAGMARAGVRGFRVRLWTRDDGPHGRDYATEVVRRAAAAGLEPYLVLFLSDDWADLMKQPAPAAWRELDLADRAAAARAYSRDTVVHFRKAGLESHLYEIGNEIDYGICGVYPGKGTKKTAAGLEKRCWPQAAELIRASQAGVREADPDARFMLHIAHWWDEAFVVAFFEFMIAQGVDVDFVGLSYFPSSNIGGSLEMDQFESVVATAHAALGRPVVVAETAYPSEREFTGQFSRWKRAVPGYPLTPDGQRRWFGDFLDACSRNPAIAAVYYWSPEWCGDDMWTAFALFAPDGTARPAWKACATPRPERPAAKRAAYFEARGDTVHPVPLAAARTAAKAALDREFATYGQMNVDYIDAITAAKLSVGGYRVVLRASLGGNLDLELTPDAEGLHDMDAAIANLDPATHRLVLFTRAAGAEAVDRMLTAAHRRNVEAVVHPVAAEEPLRFGLGSRVGEKLPDAGAAEPGSPRPDVQPIR